MRKALFIISMITLLVCCANPKKATGNYPGNSIRFGKTGGFTNIPMEYVLHDNRKIYEIITDTALLVNRITRKQMKEIENLLTAVDFQQLKINETGNITYYIKVNDKTYENIVRWTDTSENEQLKNLYKKLLTALKK